MFKITHIINLYFLLLLSSWSSWATITEDQVHFQVFTNRSVINGLALLNHGKTLWVNTNGGLEQRDGQTGQLRNVFTHVKTLPVSDGQEGQWGINRHGNLIHLSSTGEWLVYTKDNAGLPDSPINSLASEGQLLWLGTNRGLIRWQNPQDWTVFDMNNSPLPDNFLRVLLTDGSGGVWIETRNGDYVHFTGDQQWIVVATTAPQLPSSPVTSFTGDDQGGVWLFAGDSEMSLIHLSSTGQITAHNSSSQSFLWWFLSDFTRPLLTDGQGGLWVGTDFDANLLQHLSAQGEWTFYPVPNPPDEYWYYETTTALAKDNQGGGLWVGTTRQLRYLTPQGEWQEIPHSSPPWPEQMMVTTLTSDAQGGVWVGTNNYSN